MKILFIGDSITDAGSGGKNYPDLTGYTKYVAEEFGSGNEYYNRGVAGSRSCHVLERLCKDLEEVAPDVVVLLVGTNDISRQYDTNYECTPEIFRRNVYEIIMTAKKSLTGVKFILVEPYTLNCMVKERKQRIREVCDYGVYKEVIRELAFEYADGYVNIAGEFARNCIGASWKELTADGCHPAGKGQKIIGRLIADEIKRTIFTESDE